MTNPLRRTLLRAATFAMAAWPFGAYGRSLGYPRLLQGPMLGANGPTWLTVWGRASGALPLQVEYSRDRSLAGAKKTEPIATSAANDFTGVVRVDGLEPNTPYYYRVLVDGIPDRYRLAPFAARTAPAGRTDFRVAFGSCARVVLDPEQAVFDAIAQAAPDLFLWLGDNVYADTEAPEAIADEYRRQRSVPRLQPLIRSVPQLAVWDDHDFSHNNSDRTSPTRQASLATFRKYWANPAYGSTDAPGVFFAHSHGGIDFFMLDGRYHRDPNETPDAAGKTLLGAAQRKWLEERLLASRAPFKVIACGSGWSAADRPGGDTWAMFLHERNALFELIRERNVGGVVLLSGDSHVGELNCIPWSEHGGYDLYDLVSSPLAQGMSDSWVVQTPEIRLRPVHVRGPNFGVLDFTWTPEPTLTYTLRDVSGASVWQPLVLRASELRNGVTTWRSRIGAKELEAVERFRATGSYYGPR